MTTHYIINETVVLTEEYTSINAIHKKAHDLLKEHNAKSIDVFTDNDHYTINVPGTNGK